MDIKNKIYEQLVESDLFNVNYNAVVNRLSQKLKKTKQVIVEGLQELIKDKAIKVKNKKFVNTKQLVVGTFHNLKDGKGLVFVEELNKQFMVNNLINAFEGDTVKIFINDNPKKPTAVLHKIEKHNKLNIVGRVVLTRYNTYAFLPDDKKLCKAIMIPQDEEAKQAVGKKCVVTLESSEFLKDPVPYGRLTKTLGLAGDPIIENVAIAYEHGFEKEFSKEIMKEVSQIDKVVSEEDKKGRVDLRDKVFITIDPKTCKDKDDAVYIEKTAKGYRLYVAIADVSHYVKPGSKIDREAYARGTSCYLGDGVYPMLPEALSNGICSLNEGEDRLVKTVIIDYDTKGNMLDYDIVNSMINVKHGLSYDTVDDIHFNRNDAQNQYSDIVEQIEMMYKLSDALTKQREKRGALEFDTKEPEFILNDTKEKVLEVSGQHSLLTSTGIIASFMIAGNEAVGNYFYDNEIDSLNRTHAVPQDSKIAKVNLKLDEFGLSPLMPTSLSYQKVIKEIQGHKLADYLTKEVLRSMEKAKFSPSRIGHFGLASPKYLQFTSPIRRDADLTIHRILDYMLTHNGRLPSYEELEVIGLHLSDRELEAQAAERESNKLMQAIWAEDHIGEIFNGEIYDIVDEGIVVKDGLVEVFIPIYDLTAGTSRKLSPNDTYTKLIDKKSKFTYSIGDKVKFKIISADRETRKITASSDLEKVIVRPMTETKKPDVIDQFFKGREC